MIKLSLEGIKGLCQLLRGDIRLHCIFPEGSVVEHFLGLVMVRRPLMDYLYLIDTKRFAIVGKPYVVGATRVTEVSFDPSGSRYLLRVQVNALKGVVFFPRSYLVDLHAFCNGDSNDHMNRLLGLLSLMRGLDGVMNPYEPRGEAVGDYLKEVVGMSERIRVEVDALVATYPWKKGGRYDKPMEDY